MQMIWAYWLLIQRFARPWTFLSNLPYVVAILSMVIVAHATHLKTAILSPNGRNSIVLRAADTDDAQVHFTVSRHSRSILGPAPLGPVLTVCGALWEQSRVVDVQLGKVDESFQLPWGKTSTVANRCSKAVATLAPMNLRWEVELRAYDAAIVAAEIRVQAVAPAIDIVHGGIRA